MKALTSSLGVAVAGLVYVLTLSGCGTDSTGDTAAAATGATTSSTASGAGGSGTGSGSGSGGAGGADMTSSGAAGSAGDGTGSGGGAGGSAGGSGGSGGSAGASGAGQDASAGRGGTGGGASDAGPTGDAGVSSACQSCLENGDQCMGVYRGCRNAVACNSCLNDVNSKPSGANCTNVPVFTMLGGCACLYCPMECMAECANPAYWGGR